MLAQVVSEVRGSLGLFEPRKGYGAAQSSTSMELWILMNLDLYASGIIGKAQFENVYTAHIMGGIEVTSIYVTTTHLLALTTADVFYHQTSWILTQSMDNICGNKQYLFQSKLGNP